MTLHVVTALKAALIGLLLSGCAAIERKAIHGGDLPQKIDLLAEEILTDVGEGEGMRVAVVAFTDSRWRRSAFGDFLAEKLIDRLHSTGRFEVLERSQLRRIMEEHKLGLSGLVDESSAQRLGKLLGVQAILTGTVTDLGRSVDVNARLIDVETGAILATADVEITKDARVAKLLSRGRLRLSMNILAQREIEGGYEEVLVREGGTLRSRDTFQVHFSINEDCYAYVFIYDSQGRIQRLFPDRRMGFEHNVKGGELYSIPPGNLWFELDEHVGTETIYVLASYEPLPEVNRLFLDKADVELERKVGRLEGEEEIHVFSFRDVKQEGKKGKKPKSEKEEERPKPTEKPKSEKEEERPKPTEKPKSEKEEERPKHAKKPKKPIRIAGVLRGIEGITDGKSVTYHLSDGREIRKRLEVVEGEGFVARTISFRHE